MPHRKPSPVISLSSVPPSTSGRRGAVVHPPAVRGALAILGAWTVYGFVHAGFWLATGTMRNGTGGLQLSDWKWVLVAALILAWSWALLTPLIFRLTKSAAPARIGWPSSIAIHGLTFVALALGMTWLRVALIQRFAGVDMGPLLPWAVFWSDVILFTYLAVVLTGGALQSHRRYVDRALRAHVLETQLARAQLHYLELQLQPHFLFNSLNAIQELAHEAPDAAERMLRRLHALLALSLERSGRDEVSLHDELRALEPYLDIQRTRFEWLSVDVEADAGARAGLVPHLILQPLVENAIRHGLAVRRGPGHIGVYAERQGDRLLLQVRDDGVGLSQEAYQARSGIGLRNTGDRLRQLYGNDHRFELRDAADGGVTVVIELPFRAARAEVAPASWSDLGRSRETMPEVAVDEVASWHTGEFVAPLPEPALSSTPKAAVAIAPHAQQVATSPNVRPTETDTPVPPPARGGVVPPSPTISARAWMVLAMLWFGAAAFWTIQMHGYWWLREPDQAHFDPTIVKLQVAGAMYWMLVSAGVVYLARRFRLTSGHLARNLAIHFAAALTSSVGFLVVLNALRLNSTPVLDPFNLNPLSGNFFVYFGLLAWSHSRDFVAWYQARELTAAQLTSQIARSRFQALCVQVRPQFLLGTLDLLARLVHLDVPRADRLIARLADVLRLTLDMAHESVTTLQEELTLLGATVEAHRLGVRPAVSLETEIDPAALATRMPSRLLCTMADDLLAAEPEGAAVPLVMRVRAERASDATRIRLHGDARWKSGHAEPHAWWKTKSAAEAAVADAGPLVTVAFPDRATAVLIIADEQSAGSATSVAA